ncbi:BLUF domain-containing protein [Marinicellulosiphila megalodicopiae]|uniref:BLUF domain-containing protein n=1 Tax=Marinicellulosiphila megalodicopiae TaxID=2724896 RepID=UPI003BB0A8A5
MELIHLIYCSAITADELSKQELDVILDQSRINNDQAEITGMLLYDSGSFFQVLEGDQKMVEAVYEKIVKDTRHQNVTKLIMEPIEERAFGHWSMGYPRVTKKELTEIEGLNDFFVSGKSFMQLEQGRAKTLLNAFQQGKWRV